MSAGKSSRCSAPPPSMTMDSFADRREAMARLPAHAAARLPTALHQARCRNPAPTADRDHRNAVTCRNAKSCDVGGETWR